MPDVSGMVVDAGSVTVPRENNGALAALPKGTILVSTLGEGFLRELDGVATTSDTITLSTHDADLSSALVDGQIATAVGGEGKADTYQLPGIALSFSNRAIVDNAAITATLTNGKLMFSPELELDMSISGHSVVIPASRKARMRPRTMSSLPTNEVAMAISSVTADGVEVMRGPVCEGGARARNGVPSL